MTYGGMSTREMEAVAIGLEEDVDIRYIQEMLGHSSISVTQIYTHVNMAKQKDILTTKHPRKNLTVK